MNIALKKVLVVDNDRLMLDFMRDTLSRVGYEVVTAEDGLSALNILKTYTPDVMFIDLVMPNIDGRKLCKIVRGMEELRDTYVIILSATVAEEIIDVADLGANACIAKAPFSRMAQHILDVLDRPDLAASRCLSGEVIGIEEIYPRRITKELLAVKKHFNIVLERMSQGIVEITSEGRVVYANPAAVSLLSIPEEKLLGSILVELLPEDGRRRMGDLLETASGRTRSITEESLVSLNGHQFTLDILPLAEGGSETLIIMSDVTEQERQTDLLRTSETQIRNLIERNADAIIIVSPEGIIRFVNAAAERLFGRKTSELIGSNIGFPMVKGESSEIALYSGAGETKLGEIRTVEMQWEGEKAYLASIRDVTDRKRMEEELLKARKLESIGILAGGFAHDYNNLLSAIMGNLSLAQLSISPDHESFGFLKEMEKATLQARDLTKKVVTFAKGGEPIRKPALISPLLKQTVERVLGESDVKYELSIPDDLWPVEIDVYQIGQVIHNLLLNAVEAISVRGVVEGTINLSAENTRIDTEGPLFLKQGRYVKISIEDNGVGIPEEDLKMIFDPYFSTKDRGVQKGMGLGLSTCQSIIDRHEGNITVESEGGAGTTFHLYLPALDEEAPEVSD